MGIVEIGAGEISFDDKRAALAAAIGIVGEIAFQAHCRIVNGAAAEAAL